MTPEQIQAVEDSLSSLDVEALAAEFYRRAFEQAPEVTAMFSTDPQLQRQRFAAELTEIIRSIRSLDSFQVNTRALGARHRDYGVRAGHYALMGDALIGALAGASGDSWTADLAAAWRVAYNLTAESMMLGASDCDAPIEMP